MLKEIEFGVNYFPQELWDFFVEEIEKGNYTENKEIVFDKIMEKFGRPNFVEFVNYKLSKEGRIKVEELEEKYIKNLEF